MNAIWKNAKINEVINITIIYRETKMSIFIMPYYYFELCEKILVGHDHYKHLSRVTRATDIHLVNSRPVF